MMITTRQPYIDELPEVEKVNGTAKRRRAGSIPPPSLGRRGTHSEHLQQELQIIIIITSIRAPDRGLL
jgi:hypothetical protein